MLSVLKQDLVEMRCPPVAVESIHDLKLAADLVYIQRVFPRGKALSVEQNVALRTYVMLILQYESVSDPVYAVLIDVLEQHGAV
jgi:hypothetical protein